MSTYEGRNLPCQLPGIYAQLVTTAVGVRAVLKKVISPMLRLRQLVERWRRCKQRPSANSLLSYGGYYRPIDVVKIDLMALEVSLAMDVITTLSGVGRRVRLTTYS